MHSKKITVTALVLLSACIPGMHATAIDNEESTDYASVEVVEPTAAPGFAGVSGACLLHTAHQPLCRPQELLGVLLVLSTGKDHQAMIERLTQIGFTQKQDVELLKGLVVSGAVAFGGAMSSHHFASVSGCTATEACGLYAAGPAESKDTF